MKERLTRQENLYAIDGLRLSDGPILLAEIGSGHPIVAVTAAMHGNEEMGVFVLDTLRKTVKPEKGTIRLIVANPLALFNDKRFLYDDLNRAFPGEKGSKGERGLAPKILELVGDSDYTIDLHTTRAPMDSIVIVNKKDPQRVALAEATGIQKIVYIPRQKDYALIDFVRCGVGIELSTQNNDAYKEGLTAVKNILISLGITKDEGREERTVSHEYYQLIGSLPQPFFAQAELLPEVKNFKQISKGQSFGQVSYEGTVMNQAERTYLYAEEDFYTVFAGETTYTGILCLKAKRISREEMVK